VSPTPHDLEEFEPELQVAAANATFATHLWKQGRRGFRLIAHFLLGQGSVQGVGILLNLYLIHKLSIEAYAQFGLANGFQGVFAVLMDMGFAGTIVPLVADRRDDKAVIGQYVRAASHLRNYVYLILAPLASIAFLSITHHRHWGLRVDLLLLASILLGLYSGGTSSYFSAPLIIFGRLKDYYFPQALYGILRLGACLVLAVTGNLNAWTAAGLGALATSGCASYMRRKSRDVLEWPKHNDPAINRQVVQYVLPATPAILFAAFQPQISLFLVSIFGGTTYIAQVAALSRVAQMFTVITTFGNIVLEPYMARLPRAKLFWTFLGVIFLSCVGCAPIVFAGFKFPGLFIWVLGKKYEGVSGVLGWYMLSLSITLTMNLVWVMNRARKWVFWSGSMLEVLLLLGVQIAFVAIIGVRTTQQAVFLSFVASFCYVIAHGYVSILGFLKGAPIDRQMQNDQKSAMEKQHGL